MRYKSIEKKDKNKQKKIEPEMKIMQISWNA